MKKTKIASQREANEFVLIFIGFIILFVIVMEFFVVPKFREFNPEKDVCLDERSIEGYASDGDIISMKDFSKAKCEMTYPNQSSTHYKCTVCHDWKEKK